MDEKKPQSALCLNHHHRCWMSCWFDGCLIFVSGQRQLQAKHSCYPSFSVKKITPEISELGMEMKVIKTRRDVVKRACPIFTAISVGLYYMPQKASHFLYHVNLRKVTDGEGGVTALFGPVQKEECSPGRQQFFLVNSSRAAGWATTECCSGRTNISADNSSYLSMAFSFPGAYSAGFQ